MPILERKQISFSDKNTGEEERCDPMLEAANQTIITNKWIFAVLGAIVLIVAISAGCRRETDYFSLSCAPFCSKSAQSSASAPTTGRETLAPTEIPGSSKGTILTEVLPISVRLAAEPSAVPKTSRMSPSLFSISSLTTTKVTGSLTRLPDSTKLPTSSPIDPPTINVLSEPPTWTPTIPKTISIADQPTSTPATLTESPSTLGTESFMIPTLFPTRLLSSYLPIAVPTMGARNPQTPLPTRDPTTPPTTAFPTEVSTFPLMTGFPTLLRAAPPITIFPTLLPTSLPTEVSPTEFLTLPSTILAPTSTPTTEASAKYIVFFGASPPSDIPLDECTGDCDEDDDCMDGFFCFQRDKSFQAIPGCIGGEEDESLYDYCVRDPRGPIPYKPGNLVTEKLGLLLSQGLDVRLIAESNEKVVYYNGMESEIDFHTFPDAGATFTDTRGHNNGGWVYVSNCEENEEDRGGVGALTFDKDGNLIDYRMVLEGTRMNCGGGRTPWDTWVSCEEKEDRDGNIWQVDPLGERKPEKLTLGAEGGEWESFAYDVRDMGSPHFFATEDNERGCLRRFTPDSPDWVNDQWEMLHSEGIVDYLILNPSKQSEANGAFEWINDRDYAMDNAESYYPYSEGIDVFNGYLYFVCKEEQWLFILDLDSGTYTRESTQNGLFDGEPDQLQRLVGETNLLYFTEDGGDGAGVHARDALGRYFSILEGAGMDDVASGLSFSPDGVHMYVAFQDDFKLFDVWRQDGLPFQARHLDVKYHKTR